jgi:hypothetical protein
MRMQPDAVPATEIGAIFRAIMDGRHLDLSVRRG